MSNYLNNYKNEDGSTSVLIVIMMIVLMAFGMAALTTSYAGFKLAERNVDFNKEYYAMEGQATLIKFEILTLLDELSIDMEAREDIVDSESYYEVYIEETTVKVLGLLEKNAEILRDASFELYNRDPFEQELANVKIGTLGYTVSSYGEIPKYLSVRVDLFVPLVNEKSSESDMVQVLEWYEWQLGNGGVDDGLLFEDPFGEFEEQSEDKSEGDNNPFILPENND